MAVTYINATKDNRLKMVFLAGAVTPATGTNVDTGGAGKLVLGTASLSGATGVLCTITLNVPSVTISGGVATLSTSPTLSNTASASGTAAKAEFRNSADTMIISGLTVGSPSGFDINLSTTALVSASPVTITAGTITHG